MCAWGYIYIYTYYTSVYIYIYIYMYIYIYTPNSMENQRGSPVEDSTETRDIKVSTSRRSSSFHLRLIGRLKAWFSLSGSGFRVEGSGFREQKLRTASLLKAMGLVVEESKGSSSGRSNGKWIVSHSILHFHWFLFRV